MKKNITLIIILTLLIVFILPAVSSARQTRIGDAYPQLGRGTRPLGMGNAFLTMPGTDENSIFYNAAAINDYSMDFKFRILSPQVSMNYGSITVLKDTLNLNDDLSKSTTDAQKIGYFQGFVNKHSGSFNNGNVTLPIVTMMQKLITCSLIVDARQTISFRNREFPNFEVRSRNDAGLIIGSAYSLLMDDLQFGLAVKFIERIMFDKIITSNDIIANKDLSDIFKWKNWPKGFGVGVDVGAKYHLKDLGPDFFYFFDPVIAVTYQDIGNTRFTGKVDNTPQSVNAGIGIHPGFGDYRLAFEIAFSEVNQRIDILNKFHAGAELTFPKVIGTNFAIRAGCNQGYPAGGFTADWKYAKLEFAFYGEEDAEYTHQKANYVMDLNLSFGF